MKFSAFTRKAARTMYDAGWSKPQLDDTLRSRLYHALSEWHCWWDWGKPVMWLVGRYDSGSAGSPRGRDLWYVRFSDLERFEQSWFAGQHNRRGFITTTDYGVVRDHASAGWKIFDLQDDGRTIVMGYWPTPSSDGRIRPAGIKGAEIGLFWRWFWIDHKLKAQWLGLRPWIYYRALTAAVHRRKPFTCQVVPDKGSGGYSHWHCQLKRRHQGPHRYNNYVWAGPGASVDYEPAEAVA